MAATEPLRIRRSRLLLVEGNDEDRFFSNLLTYIHPGDRPIQIIPTHGKDMLDSVLGLLTKQSEFSAVTHLGIVRDADDNPTGAFASVCGALRKYSLPIPADPEKFAGDSVLVGIFIMPGAGLGGALENLCLDAVKGEPQMACVDGFANCIKSVVLTHPVNIDKLRIQSYVATISGARLIGEAADRGGLNFANTRYDALKEFLAKILHIELIRR